MTRGFLIVPFIAALVSGCGNGTKTPDLVPVTVVVTINGQPLPNAQVMFTPTSSAYGSNAIASGVTDDQGKAQLMIGSKSGACTGENRVTVMEGPPPAETRSQDGNAQLEEAKYLKSLKNRPIPTKYSTATTSDLIIQVASGQTDYPIELKR